MAIQTNASVTELWQDVVQFAEKRCSIELDTDLEAYLVTLLMRYSNQPEIAQRVFAKTFLTAQANEFQRIASLRGVGDQCLLYAGLFPKVAEKRHVKISYFVDLGRSAYAGIAKNAKDLFWSLALKFVALMDVLQSIRVPHEMLPLEAYEQWELVGSQRALQILREYSKGTPYKNS